MKGPPAVKKKSKKKRASRGERLVGIDGLRFQVELMNVRVENCERALVKILNTLKKIDKRI